jgi:hypothetical protein
MSKLNNQYEKLLDYLETQTTPKKETPVKKVITEKKQEKTNTKQLIEDSKIHSFIPDDKFDIDSKSLGFGVKKFSSMMRAKLIEEHKKLQSYERPYISVTELCNCIRQCYYVRMRYPVNLNKQYRYPYLYLIQKIGNEIHEVIQSLYDFSETEKTVVSERFKVKGRIDGIRESFLCEIKSIDDNKFKNTYIKEHYIQANIYAYILNTEYDYKIDTITMIYVLRSLKRIVAYDLPINNKLAESFLNRAPILKSSLNTTNVPDPFGATKETCKYCLFKEQCKDDKPKELQQPFLQKPKKVTKEKVSKNKKNDNKTAFLL